MVIGTYSDGRTISYDESTHEFSIEGIRTTAELIVRYDNAGQVAWTSDALRTWLRTFAESVAASAAATAEAASSAPVTYQPQFASAYGAVPSAPFLALDDSRVTPLTTNVIGRRYGAFAIDWVIASFAIGFASAIIGFSIGVATRNPRALADSFWTVEFLAFVAFYGYFIVTEALWGQTPGMAALGLRVLTVDGGRISFVQSLVRNLLLFVDMLFFTLPGFITMQQSELHQRIGDLVAHTAVVQSR